MAATIPPLLGRIILHDPPEGVRMSPHQNPQLHAYGQATSRQDRSSSVARPTQPPRAATDYLTNGRKSRCQVPQGNVVNDY